ncbi:membrane protein insertion efficiency factor YidD [Desulfosarcina ovata]|uniref:membrane protein insertion efficiency factor YidD n=1 Tax=Desulfosarcina ovata TaxID=83564 RepID=UPI0012D2FB29|nr:membrane protein insertion efficiency factor YidD [Desulfosarcina ovata]
MNKLILFFIRAYQIAVSPFLGRNCRFIPTCSEYAYQAVQTRGTIKGGFLAIKRILRCHPFHPGGYDPVP